MFTWDDGTTTDQSMSLPYQGSNAASDFVVISTKMEAANPGAYLVNLVGLVPLLAVIH